MSAASSTADAAPARAERRRPPAPENGGPRVVADLEKTAFFLLDTRFSSY
jgi:hypothetical protein